MDKDSLLAEVRRWRDREIDSHERFLEAAAAARSAGLSLRAIADVTDTTHVNLYRWLQKREGR